jgi:hypothetical protein
MNASRRNTLGLVALVLLAGGCGDGRGRSGLVDTEKPVEHPLPSTGAYGMLVISPFRDGSQVLTLRIGSEQYSLSSYQGSLTFDATKMQLVSVGAPATDFHLVNEGEAGRGVLRYAGFAVDGFTGPVELALSFQAGSPIESGDVRFDLDVLGTDVGSEITRGQVFENQQLIAEVRR